MNFLYIFLRDLTMCMKTRHFFCFFFYISFCNILEETMYFNTEILSKVENSTRKSQIFLKEF